MVVEVAVVEVVVVAEVVVVVAVVAVVVVVVAGVGEAVDVVVEDPEASLPEKFLPTLRMLMVF